MLNEKASLKSTAKAALYLLPMLVITITFNIWPIINSFLMSLYTKYDFYTDKVSLGALITLFIFGMILIFTWLCGIRWFLLSAWFRSLSFYP